MSLFTRRVVEKRAVSFQSVWGSGADQITASYSAAKAFALSAVHACLGFRSGLIGQLPLVAMRSVGGVDTPMVPQPPFVVSPSAGSRTAWLIQMQISRDLWGNAFGLIVARDGFGYPRQVEWLDPADIEASDRLGVTTVKFRGADLNRADLLIVPGRYILPGSALGVAPLDQSGLVEIASLARDFGRDWFKNGAIPSTTVFVDREIDAQQANDLRESIVRNWRNRRPAVVGTAISKIENSQVAANESQFLETQDRVASEICRSFGVRPEWIGINAAASGTVTYANISQAKQDKLDSVNIDLRVVQDIFSSGLVSPSPQFVRFNTGGYLASDMAGRYANYKLAAEIQQITGQPLLTVDEMRALENRAPSLPAPSSSARQLALELGDDVS